MLPKGCKCHKQVFSPFSAMNLLCPNMTISLFHIKSVMQDKMHEEYKISKMYT